MAKQRSAIMVVLVSMLFAALLLSAGATPARSSVRGARSSLPPQSITLEAVADTYVHEALPSHNFGTQSEVQVGHSAGSEIQTLLRFDLSSLPQYAQVTGATLSLSKMVNLASAQTPEQTLTIWVRSVNIGWGETSVNWTTRPLSTNLGDPPTAVGTGLGRTSWNVTNIVDAWVKGTRDGQRAGPTAGDRVRDPDADADPHADAHGKPYPHSDQYADPHAECHGTADPHADPKADQHPHPHAQVWRRRQLPGPGVGLC